MSNVDPSGLEWMIPTGTSEIGGSYYRNYNQSWDLGNACFGNMNYSGFNFIPGATGSYSSIIGERGLESTYPEFWFAGSGAVAKGVYSAGRDIVGYASSAGASTWSMASPTASREALRASEFFTGTKYTEKVKAQASSGDFHSFPQAVDGFASSGNTSRIIGGDGISRWKLEIPGSYRGREGIFEYIRNPNATINHRLFVPKKGN